MWKDRQTLQCLISVLLAFLPSASSLYGQPKYMVLVPSQLYTETPEKICFHLLDLNETVTVRASLQSSWGTRSLSNEFVVDKDYFHCDSFTLPRVSASDEKVSLSVHIKGPTHEFNKKSTVLVKNKESVVFVQTDKPVYKPGQSVKFRVVSMDKNLRPLNELFPLSYIEDPKTNQIMQWRDINTEHGLKQLSFSLSSEPIQGSYKIVIVKQSGVKKEHSFTVEEFVLPRFEVQVKVPKVISVQDEKVNMTVCAVYTYGKPVPGQVKISICREYQHPSRKEKGVCKEVSYQLDNNGCITQEEHIPVFPLKKRHYRVQHLLVNAKVIEEGTGFEFTGSGTTKIERTTTKLIFVKADSHFKRGIPFVVKVRLVDIKGATMPNEQIFIKSHELGYTNVTTSDQHGLAEFSINTTSIKWSSFIIKVYHKKENSCFHHPSTAEMHAEIHHVARSVYSISRSYIHLETESGVLSCSQNHTVRAHFILKGPVLRVMGELIFYYLVLAKGSIIQTGSHTHHTESGESPVKGDFALEIPVDFSMAPEANILIYSILPDGEIVADSAKFEVEKCLLNKVDMTFTPAQSLPASQAHLRVTASPQSLCGLRAVDQSMLLLRPEAELSPSWIYNLPDMQPSSFIPTSYQLPESEQLCWWDRDSDEQVYLQLDERDVYCYVEDMGLNAFTNLKIKHPKVCSEDEMILPILESMDMTRAGSFRSMSVQAHKNLPRRKYPPREDPPTETIRKYFPETWIWDLVTVNSSGAAEVEVTVPDTITEWKAGALCLSRDTGLGLSPAVSLQAFQPFFVELTMPYSVIRGEAFTLKATVLNYLPTCIRVKTFLNKA